MTTYLSPASRIPLETIASAVSRISDSLTSQPKWFQLFHPIGGVSATRLGGAYAGAQTIGVSEKGQLGVVRVRALPINPGRDWGGSVIPRLYYRALIIRQ